MKKKKYECNGGLENKVLVKVKVTIMIASYKTWNDMDTNSLFHAQDCKKKLINVSSTIIELLPVVFRTVPTFKFDKIILLPMIRLKAVV